MEDVCRDVLGVFERVSSSGLRRLIADANPESIRGLYVFRASEREARDALKKAEAENSVLPVAAHMCHVRANTEDMDRFVEKVGSDQFVDAVATHRMESSVVIGAWIYAGERVDAAAPKPSEDFGVMWAARNI